MNITADPTTPLGLGTYAWDDEGVPGERHAVVKAGILEGFLTSRETAAQLGEGRGGSMRADGWSRMPLVRMTNLHLEPARLLRRSSPMWTRASTSRPTRAGRSTTSA